MAQNQSQLDRIEDLLRKIDDKVDVHSERLATLEAKVQVFGAGLAILTAGLSSVIIKVFFE
tara:strand:- start:345 stop:527 length:183 start_codon:yes stop_codon:yes gene_type:complete